MKLDLPHCELSPTGASFPKNLPAAEWKRLWKRLQAVHAALGWILGDWINFGEVAYGERYARALDATELELQTLRKYSYVCRKVPIDRRCAGLSFSHHEEVAPLRAGEQTRFLARAEREGWSVSQLRRAIREHQQSVAEERALPRPWLPAAWRDEFLRRFRREDVEMWPLERRRALKEELRPLAEFIQWL